MASINITIPDNQVQRVIEALCARPYVLLPVVQPVPPTPAAAKQAVLDIIKAIVISYETTQAIQALAPPVTDGLLS
jgi:hypothetical protein